MIRCDGVLDIECAEWDLPVLACLYQPGGTRVFRSVGDMVDDLLGRKGVWWAHNGGKYDSLAVAEVLRQRGLPCQLAMSGSRVSLLIGGGFQIRDSWSLLPFRLEDVAQISGNVVGSLSDLGSGWECRCYRDCGGYCRITTKLDEARRQQLADYCVQDCKALYESINVLIRHAKACGYQLRGTIGGTAWATAKHDLGLPDADWPAATWRRIRRAPLAGRLVIARPRAADGWLHDIVNAYPSALAKTAVPIGDFGELGAKDAYRALKRSRPGIYTIQMKVPESFLPPLPTYDDSDRIVYPWGEVWGTWALPEIESAIERGCKPIAVRNAVLWETTAVLFDECMAKWYADRDRAGKDTTLGEWHSGMAKSIFGKLAEVPERFSVRMHPKEITICQRKFPCSPEKGCTGSCGAWKQIDMWGQIWAAPYYRQASSGHAHWAAYLTAANRVAWLAGAEGQGHHLVYGDTDSIFTTSRKQPRPAGSGFGQWHAKGAWTDWECLAPKCYRYRDAQDRRVIRSAGIGELSDDEWATVATGQRIERQRGVYSFMAAATAGRGLFRRRKVEWGVSRRSSLVYGDRTLDPGSGLTHPPCHGSQARHVTNRGESG